MLDYASLSAIAAVVHEGSFERAARVLNVTPSAISQRVKQLEERLGCVLIVRGQPCRATATGRLLCRHAEQVGLLEQDLRGALPGLTQAGVSEQRAMLRVAVNADSLGTWFIAAMAAFLESGTSLLDVALDDEEHTIEWLRSGAVLAAVTGNARPVQGCNSIALGRLRYVAAASPAYVRRYFKSGVNASSLAEAPTLIFNRKDRLQAQWMRRLCRRTIDAAVAGVGWGMNPRALIEPHLRAGTLVPLAPGSDLLVSLCWQHTRLAVPMLARLTGCVLTAARHALESKSLRKPG
jgi:LysR family transcriptional regulator (chromosome initiation inhibitor)